MRRLFLHRVIQSLSVLLAVSFIGFVLFTYIGDPVNNMLGQDATLAEREALRAKLGLDASVPVQFATYVTSVLQGDLGMSYRQQQPVMSLLAARLPATLELIFVSSVMALAIGIPLGILCALARGRLIARLVMALSLMGVSMPTFVIGVGLIFLFAVQLQWLPSFGRGETVAIGAWQTGLLTVSGWQSILLPAITLAFFQLALVVRLVRTEMLGALSRDFVRFARARGLSSPRIHFRHAFGNALVPVMTVLAIQLGSLTAFSIVTEQIFQWPGLGSLFLQAVQFADVPVMAAYLLLVALIFVGLNLLVDLLAIIVDPRLREAA